MWEKPSLYSPPADCVDQASFHHAQLSAQFLFPFYRLGNEHSKVSEAPELRFEPREGLESLFQYHLYTCMYKTNETVKWTNLEIFFFMCMCMRVHVCRCIQAWRQEDNLRYSISGAASFLSWARCLSLTWSLPIRLGLLASKSSGICRSLPPQPQDFKCVPSLLAFSCGSWDWIYVLVLDQKPLHWVSSPSVPSQLSKFNASHTMMTKMPMDIFFVCDNIGQISYLLRDEEPGVRSVTRE